MRKIIIAAALVLSLVSGAAYALKGSADVVDVKPLHAALSAAAGQRVALDVKLDIARSWHLYAHGDSMFIGVDLVPDEGFPLKDFQAVYPEGHEGEFFGEKVRMLEGKNRIVASALVPTNLPAGVHTLDLQVTVQACDAKTCLAPAKLPVQVTLTIE